MDDEIEDEATDGRFRATHAAEAVVAGALLSLDDTGRTLDLLCKRRRRELCDPAHDQGFPRRFDREFRRRPVQLSWNGRVDNAVL